MRGIVKRFPGVLALGGVDLDVRAGEVHCLLGQNGAGKSTLIKVLSASYQPDEGEILWEGEPVALPTPQTAMRPRHLHDLPGARPGPRPQRRREHLPRPRAQHRRLQPARRDATGAPRELLRPARAPRDPADPLGRPALARRPADRQHGARPLPRHPAAHPGRAVRRARPGRGQQPVPGHPRPHRRGRRRRLHLPPARGDPPDRRPDHRPQGRQHRRHRPRRRADTPTARADQADDRSVDRVRLPAPRRGRRADRRPGPRGHAASSWPASSPTST